MSEHQKKAKDAAEAQGRRAHPTQSCPECTACVAAVGSIECHAQPPVGVPIFQADAAGRPVVGGTVGIFPPVNALMWCRQFAKRAEPNVEPLPVPKVLQPAPPQLIRPGGMN